MNTRSRLHWVPFLAVLVGAAILTGGTPVSAQENTARLVVKNNQTVAQVIASGTIGGSDCVRRTDIFGLTGRGRISCFYSDDSNRSIGAELSGRFENCGRAFRGSAFSKVRFNAAGNFAGLSDITQSFDLEPDFTGTGCDSIPVYFTAILEATASYPSQLQGNSTVNLQVRCFTSSNDLRWSLIRNVTCGFVGAGCVSSTSEDRLYLGDVHPGDRLNVVPVLGTNEFEIPGTPAPSGGTPQIRTALYDFTLELGDCNCDRPAAVVVRGFAETECDIAEVRRSAGLVARELTAKGWDVLYLDAPTFDELTSALTQDCVAGLYLTGHGVRNKSDKKCRGSQLALTRPGDPLSHEIKTYFELKDAIGDRELDWIGSTSCCQDADSLQTAFPDVQPYLTPIDGGGSTRTDRNERAILDKRATPQCDMYAADGSFSPGTVTCLSGGPACDAIPSIAEVESLCPTMFRPRPQDQSPPVGATESLVNHRASQRKSGVEPKYCPTPLICDSDFGDCGRAAIPILDCINTIVPYATGPLTLDAVLFGFSATIGSIPPDTTIAGPDSILAQAALLPEYLRNRLTTDAPYTGLNLSYNVDPVDPDTASFVFEGREIDVWIEYDETELLGAGLVEEDLRAYWVPHPDSNLVSLPYSLDTANNRITATAPLSGMLVAWAGELEEPASAGEWSLNELRLSTSVWPNPVTDGATLSLDLPEDDVISVTIYDAAGRRIRSLLRNAGLPAGTHQLRWDGRTDRGETLGSGVYFHSVTGSKQTATRKVLVLR